MVKEAVFRKNPFDKRLKTHKLSGKEKEPWAFWVDYSYRLGFVPQPNLKKFFSWVFNRADKIKILVIFFVFCFITTPS